MTAAAHFGPSDRLLLLALAILTVATLAVGIRSHAFCSILCIHGDRMMADDICSGRAAG